MNLRLILFCAKAWKLLENKVLIVFNVPCDIVAQKLFKRKVENERFEFIIGKCLKQESLQPTPKNLKKKMRRNNFLVCLFFNILLYCYKFFYRGFGARRRRETKRKTNKKKSARNFLFRVGIFFFRLLLTMIGGKID